MATKMKQLILILTIVFAIADATASVDCNWSEISGITPNTIPGAVTKESYLYYYSYVANLQNHYRIRRSKYTLLLDFNQTANISVKETGKYSAITFYGLSAAINPSATYFSNYTSGYPKWGCSGTMTYSFVVSCTESASGKYVYTFTSSGGISLGKFSSDTKGILLCLQAGDNYNGNIDYQLTCEVVSSLTKTITLSACGGTLTTSTLSLEAGVCYGALPIPSRDNYIFTGWYTDVELSGNAIQETDVVPNENITLYAGWIPEDITAVTVTLNNNSGVGGTTSVSVMFGDDMPNGTPPTRDGYDFLGYFDAAYGGIQYYDSDMNSVQSWDKYYDSTLYAHWQKWTYPVTYLPGSLGIGDEVLSSKTYNTALSLKSAIFTRDHYVQIGWTKTEDGGLDYALGASYSENAPLVLYPCWQIDPDDPVAIESVSITPYSSLGRKLNIDFYVSNVHEGNLVFIGALYNDDDIDVTTLFQNDQCVTNGQITIKEGMNRIVWDVAKDWPGCVFEGLTIQIGVAQIAKDAVVYPEYMVIDLSNGSSASSYTVSYLDSIPSGGWTSSYKTTKLVLRKIPAGNDPLGRYTLTKDFYLGVFEVTQKQWLSVVGSWPKTSPSTRWGLGDAVPAYMISYSDIRGSYTYWPKNSDVDSSSFLGRLRNRTGHNEFDLPTEAQWEYACRAGTTGDYFFSGGVSAMGNYAWWTSSSSKVLEAKQIVGQKKPNPWGLYDVYGNVAEWCLDAYYSTMASGTDPAADIPSDYNAARCIRGGSTQNTYVQTSTFALRSGHRTSKDPLNGRLLTTGFRLAATITPSYTIRNEYDVAQVDDLYLDLSVASEPLPDVGDSPSIVDLHEVLEGSADSKVISNITSAAIYRDYRAWACGVKTSAGKFAGPQNVKTAPNAWLSFALGSETLIETAPSDGDLKVDNFEPATESGKFDFTVSVTDIEVGSEATAENLKKVFGLEGGTTLEPGGLSSDNVNITFGTPENGKVKFTAGPKNASEGTFFMKVKMTP